MAHESPDQLVLDERNGPPTQYWRVGTKLGEGNDAQDVWPDMKRRRVCGHWLAEAGGFIQRAR